MVLYQRSTQSDIKERSLQNTMIRIQKIKLTLEHEN